MGVRGVYLGRGSELAAATEMPACNATKLTVDADDFAVFCVYCDVGEGQGGSPATGRARALDGRA